MSFKKVLLRGNFFTLRIVFEKVGIMLEVYISVIRSCDIVFANSLSIYSFFLQTSLLLKFKTVLSFSELLVLSSKGKRRLGFTTISGTLHMSPIQGPVSRKPGNISGP